MWHNGEKQESKNLTNNKSKEKKKKEKDIKKNII